MLICNAMKCAEVTLILMHIPINTFQKKEGKVQGKTFQRYYYFAKRVKKGGKNSAQAKFPEIPKLKVVFLQRNQGITTLFAASFHFSGVNYKISFPEYQIFFVIFSFHKDCENIVVFIHIKNQVFCPRAP